MTLKATSNFSEMVNGHLKKSNFTVKKTCNVPWSDNVNSAYYTNDIWLHYIWLHFMCNAHRIQGIQETMRHTIFLHIFALIHNLGLLGLNSMPFIFFNVWWKHQSRLSRFFYETSCIYLNIFLSIFFYNIYNMSINTWKRINNRIF